MHTAKPNLRPTVQKTQPGTQLLTAANQPDVELIRELFDLTAAEARVAAKLAQGRSVEQIAGAHSVGLSTVRSQAKSILQKLGAHRQAEIAARLGGATGLRGHQKDRR